MGPTSESKVGVGTNQGGLDIAGEDLEGRVEAADSGAIVSLGADEPEAEEPGAKVIKAIAPGTEEHKAEEPGLFKDR